MSRLASHALPITWDADTDTDYANGNNSVGNAPPTDDLTSDVATFNTATPNQPAMPSDYSVSGLDFQSTGWTLSGSSTRSAGANDITSSGENTITAVLNVANAETNLITAASGGTLTLNQVVATGAVTVADDATLGGTGTVGGLVNGRLQRQHRSRRLGRQWPETHQERGGQRLHLFDCGIHRPRRHR